MPYLTGDYGNPSSGHAHGKRARAAVDKARQRIADLFGCDRREVIFTSGGTEANNLAFLGPLSTGQFDGKHIVIGGAEHPSVVEIARVMEKRGFEEASYQKQIVHWQNPPIANWQKYRACWTTQPHGHGRCAPSAADGNH